MQRQYNDDPDLSVEVMVQIRSMSINTNNPEKGQMDPVKPHQSCESEFGSAIALLL